jgi:hypothetical protein
MRFESSCVTELPSGSQKRHEGTDLRGTASGLLWRRWASAKPPSLISLSKPAGVPAQTARGD